MEDVTAKRHLAKLTNIYKNCINSIYRQINESRQSYTHTTAKQQKLLKTSVNKELDKFQKDYVEELYDIGQYISADVASRFNKDTNLTDSFSNILSKSSSYISSYISSQEFYIKNQVSRMKNEYGRIILEDATIAKRLSSISNKSRREAYDDVKSQIMIRTIDSKFEDRLGRKYGSDFYYEMLGLTVMHNVEREAYESLSVEYGYDLVQISSHLAKDACRRWENKIISLTGATEGYITFAEAKATKEVFHPRCKHYLKVVTSEKE